MAADSSEFVMIFEAKDAMALKLAQSSLEEAGIAYVVSGDDPLYIAGFPGAFGIGEIPLGAKCSCKIHVARDTEAEARAVLDPLLQPLE